MMSTRASRCAFVGSSTMLLQCIEQAAADGYVVDAVISDDRAIASALASRVPLVLPWSERSSLLDVPVDYLISVANPHVLPAEILAHPRLGGFNFHDGPLPEYSGSNVPSWAIYAGEITHAITWHRLVERVDAGEVLTERRFPLDGQENAISLIYRCAAVGREAFRDLLPALRYGFPQGRPVPAIGRRFYYRSQRPALGGILDPRRPAAELWRLVRALDFQGYPNPLSIAKLVSPFGAILVRRASLAPQHQAPPAGNILSVGPGVIELACAQGSIRLQQFHDWDGVPLDAREALARLGAQEQIPKLAPEALAWLSSVLRENSVEEPWWRARLASCETYQPLAHLPSGYHSLLLRLPEGMRPLKDDGWTSAATRRHAIGCAFAKALAHWHGTARITLSFFSPLNTPDGLPQLFSLMIPVTFEENTAWSAMLQAVKEAYGHGRFALDLPLRLGGRKLPHYQRFIYGMTQVDLPRQTEVALLEKDADHCQLLVRSDVAGPRRVVSLLESIENILSSPQE